MGLSSGHDAASVITTVATPIIAIVEIAGRVRVVRDHSASCSEARDPDLRQLVAVQSSQLARKLLSNTREAIRLRMEAALLPVQS